MKMFRLLMAVSHLFGILSLLPSRSSSSKIVLKGRQTAVVGLPYEGICTIESETYNSSDLIFETEFHSSNYCHNIESQFTEILNSTSVRLYYPEFPSEFLDKLKCITCYRPTPWTGEGNYKYADHDYLIISVKSPNTKPIIDKQSFVVENWTNLSFVWNEQNVSEKQLKLYYSCYYKKDSNEAVYKKGLVVNGRQCLVNNPFRIERPDNTLIVKVEGIAKDENTKKIIEKVSSSEESIILNKFVKPAQVNNFEVLQLESSITVLFEPPKPNRNITYNVVVKCDKDLNNRTVNVTREINCPPNNDTRQSKNNVGTHCRISKEFTDLPAFSSCTASVRAIPVAGGRWSDWKRHDFETPEGIPLRNPEICSNCFSIRQGISDSVSDVIIYFTPLSKKEAQGKIVLYKIRIFDKSFSNESFQYFNNTENNRYSFVLRNISHHTDYEIGIQAKTSKGYNKSPNMSNSIEISLSDDGFLSYPMNFSVTLINCTSNGAAVRTSWESGDADCDLEKEIFLFWCEGEEKSHTCKGVLNWRTVAEDSRSGVIVFSGNRFIFGIGIRCDRKSSGILWHRCSFNTAKCPTESTIESCRSVSFKPTTRPDSKRAISRVEPLFGTHIRSLSLVSVITVSAITALCFPLMAAFAFIKYRNRVASKEDRSKVSVVIPPPIKVSRIKIAACGSYQTSHLYDLSISRVKSDDLAAASPFRVSTQLANTNRCRSILDHDEDAFCPEDSVSLPIIDASSEPKICILPPIKDSKIELKTDINHLLPPADVFQSAAYVQDKQIKENQCNGNRMKIFSESFGDSVTEVEGYESSGATAVETISNPQLQESGYAFCKGNVPAVMLPVPSGPAQPLSYEE